MGKSKRIQTNGRPGLSRIFQKFKEGDPVAVVREPSIDSRFPFRLQGLTGVVIGERGNSYIVEIATLNKKKEFIIEPVHLKKIKQ
ncbi:MAG: 50S ribosomal protein L21e [Candidatus Nanoarchaeia archaeon]